MLTYTWTHFSAYLLVLLRMVAFVGTVPILSSKNWPVWSKLGLAAFAAITVMPGLSGAVPDPRTDPGNYIIVALLETAVGLLLGLVANLVLAALSVAGQLFDVQIGFSAATVFDPQNGQSTGLTSTFHTLLFTLYFLGLGGLDGLVLVALNSYQFVPLGMFHFPTGFWQLLMHLTGVVMVLAVQLAAPLLTALLLTDVTFAFMARAVPQMNIFVVGLPAKLFVGLSLFAVIMPGLVYMFGRLFQTMFEQLNSVLQFLGG